MVGRGYDSISMLGVWTTVSRRRWGGGLLSCDSWQVRPHTSRRWCNNLLPDSVHVCFFLLGSDVGGEIGFAVRGSRDNFLMSLIKYRKYRIRFDRDEGRDEGPPHRYRRRSYYGIRTLAFKMGEVAAGIY